MRLAVDETMGVELQVVGYQFPNNHTASYDSNWLIIGGRVVHPRGNWRFRDPCLLTYEAARLADWLETVVVGTEKEPWCGFIEPVLGFDVEAQGEDRTLRVSFAIEARPPWAGQGEDAAVTFPLERLDLPEAVRFWREELARFPQRAER